MTLERGDRADREASPKVFWTLTVLGGAVLVFGIVGFLQRGVPLGRWSFWSFGALVLHDLVVAPAYLLVAWILRRLVPAVVRPPVTVGLVLTAIVGLYSWPVLRRYGDGAQDGNPTILPGNYTTGLLTVLAVIWLGCAVWAALRLRAHRPGSASHSGSQRSPTTRPTSRGSTRAT